MGVGRKWVSAPPAPWCHALVATGVVRHHLGYSQLSNPNGSLKLVLMSVEIIDNSSDISTTLAKDFIASHSLNQSPQIPRVDDPTLITQSSLWTSSCIQ